MELNGATLQLSVASSSYFESLVVQAIYCCWRMRKSPDPRIEELRARAVQNFRQRLKGSVPSDRRTQSPWGIGLLVVSLLIFSGAVGLHSGRIQRSAGKTLVLALPIVAVRKLSALPLLDGP